MSPKTKFYYDDQEEMPAAEMPAQVGPGPSCDSGVAKYMYM